MTNSLIIIIITRSESLERVGLLKQENDALLSQVQALSSEVDRIKSQRNMEGQSSDHIQQELDDAKEYIDILRADIEKIRRQRDQFDHQLKQKSSTFVANEVEVESLKHEIQRVQSEYDAQHQRMQELRKSLNEQILANKSTSVQIHESQQKESIAVAAMRQAMDDAETVKLQLSQVQFDFDHIKGERDILLISLERFESRIRELESEQVETMHKQQEISTMRYEIESERQQMKLEKEALEKEIDRLKKRLQQQSDRVQDKIREDMERQKSEFQSEKRKLMEEMTELEIRCADMQNQLSRAVREKRAVELEWEKVKELGPIEVERLKHTVEELNGKIHRLERDSENAVYRLQQSQEQRSREEDAFEKTIVQLTEEVQMTRDRNHQLEIEVEAAKDDRVKMFNELSDAQNQLKSVRDDLAAQQRSFDLEKAAIQRASRESLAELNSSIMQLQESNSRLTKDMQSLLQEQQRESDRWHEETKNANSKYESTIQDLHEQLHQSRSQFDNLQEKYQRMASAKEELQQQVSELQKVETRVQSQLKTEESRAHLSARQIQELISREHGLIEEKRQLRTFIIRYHRYSFSGRTTS